MNEFPSSTATMLWLMLAVWLLAGLAWFTAIPGNIVAAMLIAGHAAAAAEWMLAREHRMDNRALRSIRAPVVRPSAQARLSRPETSSGRRSSRSSTFRPPTGVTPMRLPIAFALVLLVVAMISMSRIAVGQQSGLGLAVTKLCEVAVSAVAAKP
jgi:hypothetical protein